MSTSGAPLLAGQRGHRRAYPLALQATGDIAPGVGDGLPVGDLVEPSDDRRRPGAATE